MNRSCEGSNAKTRPSAAKNTPNILWGQTRPHKSSEIAVSDAPVLQSPMAQISHLLTLHPAISESQLRVNFELFFSQRRKENAKFAKLWFKTCLRFVSLAVPGVFARDFFKS